MLKKVLAAVCVVSLQIPWILFPFTVKASEDTYFVVTAYYSPLPNQNNYLRGDYEKEKILNGEWIQWASGKKVFSGMLAAPKSYAFGTKIYLEWVGIGSVEDRGGAIVPAGKRGYKYDRIDIWVGYGDEWLKRALAWGKRTVKWKILDDASTPTIDINNFQIPKNLVIKNNRYVAWPSIFHNSIGKDSDTTTIKELQKHLKNSWVYMWKEDGVYNTELIDAITHFQKEYKIIESAKDPGAWYWWIKTRKKYSSLYNSWFFTKTSTPSSIQKEKNIFDTYIHPKSSTEDIKKLQKVLKELWKYTGEETGNYKDILDIMISYQIEKTIIKKETDIAAGHFWPKTRAQMKSDYEVYLTKKKKEEEYKAMIAKLEKENLEEASKMVDGIGNVQFWVTSENVRELQIILKELGYFDYKDTAIFWKITKESIIKYQLDNEIIASQTEVTAWLVWPKTKASLKEDIAAMMLEEDLKEIEKSYEVVMK